MNKSEGIFAEYLESKGRCWAYEPMRFILSESTYRPDFYCPDNDTFYEVANTRQAFNFQRKKYERFVQEYPHIKFVIVHPSGELYALNKLVVVRKNNNIKSKKRILTFYVFKDYLDKMKRMSETRDCTVSLIINQAVDEYFDKGE